MKTVSKSLVARIALGLVALTGLVAAVPASAHSYDGYGRGERDNERAFVERDYRDEAYRQNDYRAEDYRRGDYQPVEYGYARHWHRVPMIRWHAHYGYDHDRDRGRW